MVIMYVLFIGLRGHFGDPFFFPFRVFLFSRNSRESFWGLGILAFMDFPTKIDE